MVTVTFEHETNRGVVELEEYPKVGDSRRQAIV
ncbi:hypothetical protein XMM3392_002259 [Aliiroseovarius sp. xm-m-339-2]|nr:hypothetical protein [Aliiroseovarius sp. xm-m-339-2]NRP62879.1 hypothetical protein [Aliiroseovarius sp. xm-a-151]